jgi:hypothetical protein
MLRPGSLTPTPPGGRRSATHLLHTGTETYDPRRHATACSCRDDRLAGRLRWHRNEATRMKPLRTEPREGLPSVWPEPDDVPPERPRHRRHPEL